MTKKELELKVKELESNLKDAQTKVKSNVHTHSLKQVIGWSLVALLVGIVLPI